MAIIRCSKEWCHAPEDYCQERGTPEHTLCEHFASGDNQQQSAEKETGKRVIPWSGDFLQPKDLELVSHRGSPKIIGLIGASGAGKTTYLAMLYTLLFNGKKISGWDFSGSYTLKGWELQAKTLQVQESGSVVHPEATPSDKVFYSIYHLALRNKNHLIDILFADSSGEVFSRWAYNVNDPSAENAKWIYQNATGILFFIDCQAIVEKRGRAKKDIIFLAEQVSSGLNGRPIILLWSKADKIEDTRENIRRAIEERLSILFPQAFSFQISNYSKSGSDEFCQVNNLEAVRSILDQMASLSSLKITPKEFETEDYFFLYRGNHGNK